MSIEEKRDLILAIEQLIQSIEERNCESLTELRAMMAEFKAEDSND